MKHTILLAALLVPTALSLGSRPAHAAACPVGTLEAYIALGAGGCEIDATAFRNFASLELPFGSTQIDPADVTVSPLLDDPSRPGFAFGLDASAAAGELFEILIGYQAFASALLGVELALDGASVQGDGAVTAVEDVCLGGSFDPGGPTGCSGDADDLIAFDVGVDAEAFAALGFGAVSFVSVVKDIAIDGGLDGFAALAGVSNRFVIPEPATALLLAAGLLVVARANRTRS